MVPGGSGLRGLSGARGPLAPGPTLGGPAGNLPPHSCSQVWTLLPPSPHSSPAPPSGGGCPAVPSSYLHALWAGQRPLGPRHDAGVRASREQAPLGTHCWYTMAYYSPNRCSEVKARLDRADISGCWSSWNRKRPAGAACSRYPAAPPTSQTQTRSALFFLDPLFLPGCHSSLLCCLS